MEPNPHGPPRPDAYQHWLDDAASMGLMLYRMRNDSKRERLLMSRGRPSHQPPPSSPINLATTPLVVPKPEPVRMVQPIPIPNATPRTSRALQTPTVATQSTSSGDDAVLPQQQQRMHYQPLD